MAPTRHGDSGASDWIPFLLVAIVAIFGMLVAFVEPVREWTVMAGTAAWEWVRSGLEQAGLLGG